VIRPLSFARLRLTRVRRAPRIERMLRINRHAIGSDRVATAALVDGPDALMAIAAERAQRPDHELVVIAAMPWVMIGDRRRREAALLLAQGAKRGGRELMVRPSSPGLQGIPISPMERLGGREIARVHRVRD
jgi:hypothetical protein